MQFSIREMDSRDLLDVEGLCAQFGFPVSRDKLLKRYQLIREYSSQNVWVATEDSGHILGWIHAYEAPSLLSDRTVEVGGLIVDGKYRRQGIGQALMKTIETWALDRGFDEILLASRIDRTDARGFYGAIGYEFIHTTHFLAKSLAMSQG